MCGRYALTTPPEIIAELLRFHRIRGSFSVRYNVAPTQTVPVVRQVDDGEREMVGMHWGLIPSWAKERSIGNRLINARCESADEKPAFRHAFRKRRCVIPASGFFEWKKLDPKTKQPYYITRADGLPMLFAGLWESWNDVETGKPLESCTILTTEANAQLRELHDRMPVVLDVDACERWLSPAKGDDAKAVEELKSLLAPLRREGEGGGGGEAFALQPVSTRINSPKNDDASVLTAASGAEALKAANGKRARRSKAAERKESTLFD